MEYFITWHNNKYGTLTSLSDLDGYDISSAFDTTYDEMFNRVQDFLCWVHLENQEVKPIDMAVTGINILKRVFHHELFLVTSREVEHAPATKNWIAQHFPNTFVAIIHCTHPHTKGQDRSKVQLCKDLGIQLIIDDLFHQVVECAEIGIPGILFGDLALRQVGQTGLPNNVTHAKDWGDVIFQASPFKI